MRILLISHAPLNGELGAAQIALNLAAALRGRGHDAEAWHPDPLPPDTRWWNLWHRQRTVIERYADERGPFDVIDTPAVYASRKLAAQTTLVVRSIQPELHYLWEEVRSDLVRHRFVSPRSIAHAAIALSRRAAILSGWRRARLILCLGSLERSWMLRRFPHWRSKVKFYVGAPSPAESSALAEVRRQRRARQAEGVRFLWMGRWATHKGLERLVRWIADRLGEAPADTITLAGCGAEAEQDLRPEWLRSGRVRVVPAFSRAELPALLASHDAGVFTSIVEGWGLSLNEMLESGMPVFATPAGGVGDLQPFWTSRLLPFPPPIDLAEPAGPGLDLDGYLSYFSWPEIARRYEEDVAG